MQRQVISPAQRDLIDRIAGPGRLPDVVVDPGAPGVVAEDPVTGDLTIVFPDDFSNGGGSRSPFGPGQGPPTHTGPSPDLDDAVSVPISIAAPGDDLRDFTGGVFNPVDKGVSIGMPLGPGLPAAVAPILLSRLLILLPSFFRNRVLTFFRAFSQNAVIAWERLPNWMRVAMVAVGLTGVGIVVDEVFFDGPNLPVPGDVGGHLPEMPGGGHIVGTWQANGVIFYRLSDGKLAVQNKHGRWKVWRPKKPIVLMPGGAGDLRTLLRADAVLNKQAKKIAAMLNRRTGGSRRKSAEKTPSTIVLAQDGSKITQI